MATSSALPTNCPSCGYSFTLVDTATIEAHFLGHLVMNMQGSDTSKDW